MDADRPTCATCRFKVALASANGSVSWLECRAKTPTRCMTPEYHLNGDGLAYYDSKAEWPRVKPTDWCGEHEPQRPAASTAVDADPVGDDTDERVERLRHHVGEALAWGQDQLHYAKRVTAERDRYREALENISKTEFYIWFVRDIANAALEAK